MLELRLDEDKQRSSKKNVFKSCSYIDVDVNYQKEIIIALNVMVHG